jgi:hypothetical protein
VLEGKIISGSSVVEKIFIPRLSLSPSDIRVPFKFQKPRFPLVVSFAMTINKSQVQSLQHVGYSSQCLYFHIDSYMLLYLELHLEKDFKILIDNEDIDVTSNFVHKEVFRNIQYSLIYVTLSLNSFHLLVVTLLFCNRILCYVGFFRDSEKKFMFFDFLHFITTYFVLGSC